ncbi:DUF7002 family protein [Edaphocola flava]|uniref:DUF7002 family protein n=1 Tax=Edaphocola flava TaxID=2499629 RepID=UPI00100B9B3C|nr:hypothetical protein [Edaphocola flava]
MELKKFINDRSFLYHLTNEQNASNILKEGKIYSANTIIDMSNDKTYNLHKRSRRTGHVQIVSKKGIISLRDQRPISEKALAKCLTNDWSVGDFLYHLNDRVFMWPTLERLWRHFKRYEHEKPTIFRFSTSEIISANPHVKFCRLNSGATRANSHLGGKPPARGIDTFLSADHFKQSVREVAEVTFEGCCIINGPIWIGERPDSVFKQVDT